MVSHQQFLSPTLAFKSLYDLPPAYFSNIVSCYSPSQLYTYRAPKQIYCLHLGVFCLLSSLPGIHSPPQLFHSWYCMPDETLYHSTRSISYSWKPSLAFYTKMSSSTFEPPLWQVQHLLCYFSNYLFASLLLYQYVSNYGLKNNRFKNICLWKVLMPCSHFK